MNSTVPISAAHFFFSENYTEIYYKGGLISDVWLLFIGQSIVSLVFVIGSPTYFWRFIKKFGIWIGLNCGCKTMINQEYSHRVYEKNEFDLDGVHSELLLPIMISFFYQQIMPIGSVFSLGSTFLLTWIHKIKFVYMSRSPEHHGPDIILTSLYILNMMPFTYGVGRS